MTEALDNLKVKDVMVGPVVTLGEMAPVAQAAAVMFERRIGSVVVVEGGALVGIVTEDLQGRCVPSGRPAGSAPEPGARGPGGDRVHQCGAAAPARHRPPAL